MSIITALLLCGSMMLPAPTDSISLTSRRALSIESLGACQGASFINGKAYLYGDREVGVIREYVPLQDSLAYTQREVLLTIDGKDVINHPTGIAYNGQGPTFIGNSVRLNKEGTSWKALIYAVDWEGMLKTGTLDGNLDKVIEDDACIQGTRPEYVRYGDKWYVATADYGNRANEVRLYDPEALSRASRTSEEGVLFKKFTCGPWVQNLHWIPEKDILVLIQNQVEGRKWRFTFLDLSKSIDQGREEVLKVVDLDYADELEGFTLLGEGAGALGVTSSRKANAHLMELLWE
ncbi:hypothetical protein C8N40_10619 [Pontibacter mucosus]|uniref:Glutamine cyclotransferase n=1 Tax=Pontibacter mucosus TaxID=1649266 RepID=A0A2T5YFY1_9BACT|nr:hypothetical protein C8N40_10619 [Pontibacter mucosus]